jgi:threonine synthase
MFGFQAEGAAPIVRGEPVLNPETIATAIRVGNPASWRGAVAARDESNGLIDSVSDEQILHAYRLLPSTEGVFVEPGSASSVAGLLRTAEDGRLPKGSVVVCTVTGHGLKDPDTVLTNAIEIRPLPVDPGAVASALDLS